MDRGVVGFEYDLRDPNYPDCTGPQVRGSRRICTLDTDEGVAA